MNVSQLQLPPQPQLQRVSREASEKDADFLALRLLNKRSRLRLSPQPLDLDALPGKGRLFAVANHAGWFAAATRQSDGSHVLVLSPLAHLRSAFASSSSDGPLSLQPQMTIPLHAAPQIVVFTLDDARLLVAYTDGSISVHDARSVFQPSAAASPLHVFPSPSGNAVRDILPSPGDTDLVAVLREPRDDLPVEILDLQKMTSVGGWKSGGSPETRPLSVSWSPKGKQIALGLESGEVVTFSPTETSSAKSIVPRPPAADGQSVISAVWLSNSEFHTIYVPAGHLSPDVEQSHYILSLDSKANMAGDVKLTTPYLPFPGLRPPGSFIVVLRNWEPSRLLLFIGDSTSSDIGLIGSLSESGVSQLDSWYNLTLEETSTPSVPLDADMNETVLLGLDLDLTNDKPFEYTGPSGEVTEVPPTPIVYLYASDGTLTGWHIVQTRGMAYPGMVAPSAAPPTTSPTVATLASTSPAPQIGFASPAAPAVGPSQPSAFGSTSTSPGPAVGFGAFSGGQARFGTTGFGFGVQTSPTQSLQAPPLSTPSMSVEMASANEDSMVSETDTGLGGMSLGGDDTSQPKPGTGTNSMFGSFGSNQQTTSTSAFGGGATASPTFTAFGAGPIKPATGFGAFAGSGASAFGASSAFGGGGAFGSGGAFGGSTSAFAKSPTTGGETSKPVTTGSEPASTFGQSSFGADAAKPAFGQSSFGKPAFGQPAFGSSSFGATTTPAKPPTSGAFGSGAGGFAAFASAPASFASAAQQTTPDSKPAWSSDAPQAEQKLQGAQSADSGSSSSAFAPSKPAEATPSAPASTGGAFAGLGQSSQSSAFGKSVFGQSSFGQSSFGQPAFGQSAFGKSGFGQPTTPSPTFPKPVSATPSTGGFAGFANASPSTFTAAASQQSVSNESKPVWATPATDKPKGEEAKPAFGTASSAPSASNSPQVSSASAVAASTTPAVSPEKPAGPATPVATPPATPDNKPTAEPTPSTAPATSAAGGAFSGLTTSTTGFPKLQTGFGAFGSTTSTSSPFMQKPATTSQPSALFGQTSFGAATARSEDKDGTTKPAAAFGSPSPLGQTSLFGKPGLGSSPSPFLKPVTAPATSAFSAFSSASSPFAAAAGAPKKSFGDMLREKEGEKVKESVHGVSKTAEEWKKPVSVFASLKQAAAEQGESAKDEEEDAGNISFRSHGEEEEDEEEGEIEEGSEAGDDGIDDFLKSDEEEEVAEEEGKDVEEEEEDEEEEEAAGSKSPPESPTAKQPIRPKSTSAPSVGGIFISKDARSASPSAAPSPIVKVEPGGPKSVPSRQRSTTPPGSPSERASPALADRPVSESKGKAPAREGSTTPPGSPAVATISTTAARATSAPPASASSSTPPSGLLGLGRPSTRPVRSSPLATQPISGDDLSEEEEEEGQEEEEEEAEAEGESLSASPKKARSASPALPTVTAKAHAQQPTSRPKTPPLLFGGPAKPPTPSPFTLSPAASPLPAPKIPAPISEKTAEPVKPASPAPTPPLTGHTKLGTPSIFNAPPVFSPPAATQGGLFGRTPVAAADGPFGQRPAAPAPAFGSSGFFSAPLTPPTAKTESSFPSSTASAAGAPSAPRPAPLFGGPGRFGTPGPSTKLPAFGLFGTPPAISSTTVPASAPLPPAPAPSQASIAQDMQTECLYLYNSLQQELEDLKALAKRASARAAQMGKPGSGNKTVEDLTDPTKWILGDLPQFKQLMKEVVRELERWEEEKAVCISYIRELESDMLKATTRREEIARFSKASRDAEFARVLKARTLSPEHLETQAQLRREIRTIRGRIQQLEDHIQAAKKKLNSLKNGKPTLKPPSLDTINRTYRNIDLAIEQEEEDVSNLADRAAQLDLSSHSRGLLSFSTPSTRDKRLPDRRERVGREVTPNIAASTAAALNAERSAQKLKRALLSARKEPLLNTKAVNALPPEREVRTSRKPLLAPDSGLGVGAAFAAGMNNGFPSVPGLENAIATAPWVPRAPSGRSASSSHKLEHERSASGLGAMRASKAKNHGRPIHPNQNQSFKPPPVPPPAGFSWGPIPKIEPKQTVSVFTELGNSGKVEDEEETETNVKEEEKELESSWVAEGFLSSTK
ncbi:hypothetical protein BD414DRAFT_432167 [Trametes punicea]|nr:hypothetical protein BD414DRAFT_432167 [Trametes punicea]